MAENEGNASARASTLTYDQWAQALGDFFFDKAHNGEEILFAIDELSLAEASGLEEEKVGSSLAAAVRLEIGVNWNVGVVKGTVDRWRKAGLRGPHPALPFLSLTVLAASQMGGYEGFAAHKFYVPLRRAMVPDDQGVDAPGTYLDYVRALWNDIARWANEDLGGRRGRLTIRDPGWHYGRGLAIQHALVKSSDLRQLDAFFRRIGLQPGEDVAPAELRRALAIWTGGRPEPWAHRLHRISADDDLAEYSEALLSREARRWDGRPRDPRTGRPVGRIRLGFPSTRRPHVGLFVQWDERLPEAATISLPAGGTVDLTRVNGWYEPHPLANIDEGDAMAAGLAFRGDGLQFDLRAEEVYALSYDDDLGRWVSVDSMSYGDRYHLLVCRDVVNEVLRFVRAESTLDAKLDEAASRSLPAGWKLIVDVRIDARPKTSPPSALGSLLRAGAGPRLRLLGGLPLTSSQGVYLRGGEPALALSTVSEDDRITIRRQSTGEVERFRITNSANREISLWHLNLEPDRYEIRHGESKVTLQIVDGIAESAGPGAGSVVHRGARSSEVVGTATVPATGRRVPLTVPAPPPGESLIVLGARPGEHHIVELPVWLSRYLDFELSWRRIDAWPDFDPAWILLRGGSGRFEASLVHEIDPDASDGAATSQWGRLIARAMLSPSGDERSLTLWERYRHAAGCGVTS